MEARGESAKEQPYIERNIEATREAYAMADVKEADFAAGDALGDGGIEAHPVGVQHHIEPAHLREGREAVGHDLAVGQLRHRLLLGYLDLRLLEGNCAHPQLSR
mgnify:CR=1 FL=1